jgi:hypothetical protein
MFTQLKHLHASRFLVRLFCISFSLLSANQVFAQPPDGPMQGKMGEKVKVARVAYLTRELDLTEVEAQKFWPIYNKFDAEREKIRMEAKVERLISKDDLEKMSDAEVEAAIQKSFDAQEAEVKLRRTYHAEFRKVLSTRKVAILYRAEEDFKRELLRELRERRDARMGDRPPPPPRLK